MFANRIDLFRMFGFRVSLDLSWFLIAFVLVWSLATAYFPWAMPAQEPITYWLMAIGGALGLFASIILHELAHAIVARRFGLPIGGITLFIFGGIAEMEDEPKTPAAEFWMAIAGPIASVVIGAICYLPLHLEAIAPQSALAAVLGYLAFINFLLAAFNMLPAFPLDGGRVLRSVLWWFTGNLTRATRIAAAGGSILGLILIGFGILNMVSGNFVGGLWQMLIGFFLYAAAGGSQRSTELRVGLEGIRVAELMTPDPVTIARDLSIADAVDGYFYRYHRKLFPVVSSGRLIGCLRLEDVNALPRERWETARVEEVMSACGADVRVTRDMPMMDAVRRMQVSRDGRLFVVDGDRLEGILTSRDVMNFVAIRSELPPQRQPGGLASSGGAPGGAARGGMASGAAAREAAAKAQASPHESGQPAQARMSESLH